MPAEALAAPVAARPAIDVAVRRLLRIPDQRARPRPRDVHRAFSRSILISATRCVLTYVVLPFLAPAFGFANGVAPWVGIPIAAVAVFFNILSIRRFWAADHKWRWAYTAIGVSVISLLLVLVARDVADLFS